MACVQNERGCGCACSSHCIHTNFIQTGSITTYNYRNQCPNSIDSKEFSVSSPMASVKVMHTCAGGKVMNALRCFDK